MNCLNARTVHLSKYGNKELDGPRKTRPDWVANVTLSGRGACGMLRERASSSNFSPTHRAAAFNGSSIGNGSLTAKALPPSMRPLSSSVDRPKLRLDDSEAKP